MKSAKNNQEEKDRGGRGEMRREKEEDVPFEVSSHWFDF